MAGASIGDIRWGKRWILTTLFGQFALTLVILGICVHGINSMWLIVGPLWLAAITALNLIVHIICFFTSSLHPLVVLTLSIEFMIMWLSGTILVIVMYLTDSEEGCRAYDSDDYSYYSYSRYYDDDDDSDSQAARASARNRKCKRSIAVLAFCVILTLSYIWLVTYSAIVRKKTRMPYVPVEKRPLLPAAAEEGLAQTPMGAVAPPVMAGAASSPRAHSEAYAPSVPPAMGADPYLQPGPANLGDRASTISPVSTMPEAVNFAHPAGTPPPPPPPVPVPQHQPQYQSERYA